MLFNWLHDLLLQQTILCIEFITPAAVILINQTLQSSLVLTKLVELNSPKHPQTQTLCLSVSLSLSLSFSSSRPPSLPASFSHSLWPSLSRSLSLSLSFSLFLSLHSLLSRSPSLDLCCLPLITGRPQPSARQDNSCKCVLIILLAN